MSATAFSEKIYILLPVHNRRAITQRFIESLIRQQYQNYHLVLIDDGSTDGTEEMVRSYVKDLTVIRGEGNWWWGGALHQGYLWLAEQTLAADDVVLIMNDDTEFSPDFLTNGLDIIRNNPNALLVSRCYDRLTKALIDPGTYYMNLETLKFHTVDGAGEVNCTSTRGLFLLGTDMLAIGGFYPKLLPHYFSDIEFTLRAHKRGFKILSDSRLILFLDDEATGFHNDDYGTHSAAFKVKRFFSRKSSDNPIYWTSFILLVCPWASRIKNIPLLWVSALSQLVKQLFLRRPPKCGKQ